MNEFHNEPSAIKRNSTDGITESNVYDTQNPNENTAQNLNNTFYSQVDAKNVNYKAIFEKQVYYDKLLNRINNIRSFIFVIIGVLHFYNSTNESLKIEYFSNVQFLFSLMIITETLLGMLLIKLKDNKKKNILDKITENELEQDNKNLNLMKFSKILSYLEMVTPIFTDFLTLFFVNFLLICYYSI